nr:MAG TPA: hypothetical protein [Bacteriophage sp.]
MSERRRPSDYIDPDDLSREYNALHDRYKALFREYLDLSDREARLRRDLARYQTGAWVAVRANTEDNQATDQGERP